MEIQCPRSLAKSKKLLNPLKKILALFNFIDGKYKKNL